MSKKNLAIFASGRGSNAQAILEKESASSYKVKLFVVSKKNALAVEIAKEHNIAFIVLEKSEFQENDSILEVLKEHEIDFICLAGFLWKIPHYLIQAYRDKIVNIHPSLLPSYGGKGMYGMKVHEAVVANKESQSGITIHLVNEEYDKGRVLFQEKLMLDKHETPDTLASRILVLEHRCFPRVLDGFCAS